MNARKRLFAFLFAALSVLLFTACGKWDYSREAMKAANDAQGQTLRVEFKVNQTFTSALRAAVEDNIQPNDVDKAMTMDKSIAKLLTSGYRLDVYALHADIDADQAAAQLADEFVNRLAGCEDEGFISMVKADNGYFYMAVLTYKHGGSGSGSGGGSGSGDEGSGEPEEPETTEYPVQWYENASGGYEAGTLILRPGASAVMGNSTQLTFDAVKQGLSAEQYKNDLSNSELTNFSFKNVQHLIVKDGSGVTEIAAGVVNDSPVPGPGFWTSQKLETIELYGVESIGDAAFASCWNLQNITISGSNNLTIGDMAFSSDALHCNVNTVNISAQNSITLEQGAFHNTFVVGVVGVDKKVIFSAQEIIIGENAFFPCKSHVEMTFDGEVMDVGSSAFGTTNDNHLAYEDLKIHYTGGAKKFAEVCPDGKLSKAGLHEDNFADT